MPDEQNGEREKLHDLATDIYRVDRLGILLNGLISGLSSTVATVAFLFTTEATLQTAVLAFMAMFVPQVSVKVIGEYAKKRAVAEGQIQAFIRGARLSDTVEFHIPGTDHGLWLRIFHACNSASLFRSPIFDGNTTITVGR